MKNIDKIEVFYHNQLVGTLMRRPDGAGCVFGYSDKWLAGGFSLSPFELPLESRLFVSNPEKFHGNFAAFEDSMPDGYGLYLLNRILRKKGSSLSELSVLQRMSIVGNAGMGALCYRPATNMGNSEECHDLDRIQKAALEVLSEKTDADADYLYYNSGNSGGARPKIAYKDNNGLWLIKFRHTYDPETIGKTEYLYNAVAEECGIIVPEYKLFKGKYFASKRFDIDKGTRLHILTASALLQSDFSMQNVDYTNLLALTGYLTQDSSQVEQMFRRMVFNIIADNKDDHAKNFSFIYREGKWELAPAYDLTYSPGGNTYGERATSVRYNGKPGLADVLKAAAGIRINESRCREIIEEVQSVCINRLERTVRLI